MGPEEVDRLGLGFLAVGGIVQLGEVLLVDLDGVVLLDAVLHVLTNESQLSINVLQLLGFLPVLVILYIIGWRDFEKIKVTHCMLCQMVVGPQFQNFMPQCCFFTCSMASENFKCYPKMSKKMFYLLYLKFAP